MNEISVIVKQEPGTVTWNFEEIRKRLREELEVYKNTAYTDDTIKTAKSDVADLRKLAAAIEDRRKEVKERCLEPYAAIEAQAKELVSLIDEPISAINEQVKDYEKRRKERVRSEILAYYQDKAKEIPEQIRDKVYQSIYDTKWENVTATRKLWREGIGRGIADVTGAIGTIRSFGSEFEEDMLVTYYDTLNLQASIRKMNELKAQKERILEMERRKKEQEERAAKEKQEAEEKAKAATEEKKQENALTGDPVPHPLTAREAGRIGEFAEHPFWSHIPEKDSAETQEKDKVSGGSVSARESQEKTFHPETKAYPNGIMKTIHILGTKEQIGKILNFIRYTGADYREV